jgi:hypothetical protein
MWNHYDQHTSKLSSILHNESEAKHNCPLCNVFINCIQRKIKRKEWITTVYIIIGTNNINQTKPICKHMQYIRNYDIL